MTDHWKMDGETFVVTFWRRPLTAMTGAIAAAGFLIEQLVEPSPAAGLLQRDAEAYRKLATAPRFLFFRLVPSPDTRA